ncbi:MAG TPA: FAD-dependent oxidoreductase [Rubrobacteraceae bacterium]|nr:FAD-dependent oxidoreductase [Rubrobacteraceae bacterium]
MRLVIIGGVAAGTKAASRARRMDPDLEITLYQEEPEVSISECGLPYYLSGMVNARERLVARTPEKFAAKDIEVLTRHRVEKIDPESRKLTVRDLTTDNTFEDTYDRLIIATGARAVLPPISGAGLDGVFKLRFLTDADEILRYLERHSPKKAVIVGGGYIGLELAENLCALGLEVSLIEGADRVALAYGPEVSARVEDHLREKGVKIYTGENVEEFTCEGDREGCVKTVRFGETGIDTDLVVVGIGVKPSVELAQEAGGEIGETGAIKVDRHMKTNLPDVWAAGDCVETTNLASGKPAWVPLGDTANQMGRVAGTNAVTGQDTLEFPGVLGTGIFKVFDLGVAKTGLSEKEAADAGFDTVSATVEATDRAGYYPGVKKVFLNLIADRATGRILGAESAGSGADKLVDICATAIWGRLSYPDLVNIDLAYSPPYGPALSPVIQAATILSGKFERAREEVRASE